MTLSPSAPAIELRQVSKRFGAHEVLKNVSLSVATGEVIVVCGPSGSGKSTLIRTINRLEELDGGEIYVGGEATSGLRGRQLQALRTNIGFVFQQFNLYGHLTALENITLALERVQGLRPALAVARAEALLARVGLPDKAHHYARELSGGQQQRVAIARALATEPGIILFDEPTSALDPEMIGEVLSVIRSLAHTGITMIVVTHEMGFARELADRIVFIDHGEILEVAPPSRFFTHARHPRVQRFLQQILPASAAVAA